MVENHLVRPVASTEVPARRALRREGTYNEGISVRSTTALSAAALTAASALLAGPAVATATAAPSAPSAASAEQTATAAAAAASKKNKKSKKAKVRQVHIKKYKLKGWELRGIKKSKKWAKTPKAKSVRWCESNGRYKINTGNGYYGAWQFAYGTWLGSGGGRYESHAHKAPKFAQDHIAWKLWKSRGWQPWGCA